MDNIIALYNDGHIVPDDVQVNILIDILSNPDAQTESDVDFLISKTVCPVDGETDLLSIVFSQNTFPGQLNIARMLIAAGAPTEKGRSILNAKFEHMFELLCMSSYGISE